MKDSEQEVNKLKAELEREKNLSDTLQREVDINSKELEGLDANFKKLKADLDNMNFAHDSKLKELEGIRGKANEEIKRLSLELSQAQSEINVLILESQKYES